MDVIIDYWLRFGINLAILATLSLLEYSQVMRSRSSFRLSYDNWRRYSLPLRASPTLKPWPRRSRWMTIGFKWPIMNDCVQIVIGAMMVNPKVAAISAPSGIHSPKRRLNWANAISGTGIITNSIAVSAASRCGKPNNLCIDRKTA